MCGLSPKKRGGGGGRKINRTEINEHAPTLHPLLGVRSAYAYSIPARDPPRRMNENEENEFVSSDTDNTQPMFIQILTPCCTGGVSRNFGPIITIMNADFTGNKANNHHSRCSEFHLIYAFWLLIKLVQIEHLLCQLGNVDENIPLQSCRASK